MVYKGLPPKDENARVNRIPKRFDKTSLDRDDEVRGPELPATAPQGRPWCARAIDFWETWRRSPQAQLMIETDWDFLLDTAILVNDLWRPTTVIDGKYVDGISPTAKANYMAEIRQRVSKFGATWEDRQKLQLSITEPISKEEEEERVVQAAQSAVDYAERLTKRAAEIQGE